MIKELISEKGGLITVTSRPGVGKSTLLKMIVDVLNKPICYFSLEENKETLLRKLNTKKPPIIIDKIDININEVVKNITELASKNIKVFMIDYLQLISIDNTPYFFRDTNKLKILKNLVDKLNITIIVASQLPRLNTNNDVSVPLVYDYLKDKNPSDIILLLTSSAYLTIEINVINSNGKVIFTGGINLDLKNN